MTVAAIYNPQEMQEDLFVERFVVRRDTLAELLQRIRQTEPEQTFKHTIIQGLRGQGKTTLLRKLSICVRDDAELSPWLIPVLFREEEYSVTSLCRLWELVGDYLAERPEFEALPERFEEAYASPHYEKDCFSILADALQQADKSVLLLIDNLGEMLEKFDIRDQQRLREILQTNRRVRIVGASAVMLEQHYDQGKPFFQFFTVKTLSGLNREETHELLLGLGNAEQTAKMREILQTKAGKVEALRRLTAGVPRTMILLFEIFLDDHGSALDDLEMLLDRVTPLYKHRLDDLPTQQQSIVHAIALGWDAMSTKEIAAKTKLASKLVSAQLKQLEKNRLIRCIPTSTKNHLYQLEDRFFNIWCLMRLGRKNDKQRAIWLVKFLESWCDEQELAERAERHMDALKQGKLAPRHALLWSQALAQSLRDLELQQRLLDTTREFLPQISESLPESDYVLFDKADEAYRQGDLKEALKLILPLAEKGIPRAMGLTGVFYQDEGKLKLAESYYQKTVEKGLPVGFWALARLHQDQGKFKRAERYYLLAIEKGFSDATIDLAKNYAEQDKLELAEHYFSVAAGEGDAEAICDFSTFYLMHGLQPGKALKLLRNALEIEPKAVSNKLLGLVTLWNEDYLEAFNFIDQALIELEGDQDEMRILLPLLVLMLVAKGQTAFALKLFENEKYRHLNLKEHLKPYYYAVLQEIGESRRDDVLRMGPELEQTVAEIRASFEGFRLQYRLLPEQSTDANPV
ncbi:SEL1-like repeat protein [Methylomonas rhizoryzae]|uniref:tetratricopeptide repeat protein n=1 Tax=Methylomonas rhizoryzae TaxID=2608981 RepID=UPI0012325335|nr:tetratricopeptide repeat protein [Methylomonas rhizoryzae]